MLSLDEKWLEQLVREGLFKAGDRLVLAVSGGLDSMVLLHLLKAAVPSQSWKLHVAHFNHCLRGPESDADARFVRQTAEELGLPYHEEAAPVESLKGPGESLEMAARRLRHAFLARTAVSVGAPKVVLAHHLDDQVELFYLRLLRGAGSEGLGGMRSKAPSPACSEITLLRPLLEIPRATLLASATKRGLDYREDASNRSLKPRRNQLRHELLPLLRDRFQPALTEVTGRMMQLLRDEAAVVEHLAAVWLSGAADPFPALLPGLQRQILRLQLRRLGVDAPFDRVEELRLNPEHQVNLDRHRRGWRDANGRVHLEEAVPSPQFSQEILRIDLEAHGNEARFSGRGFQWKFDDSPAPAPSMARSGNGEEFDASKVGTRICLRHWRPGDRYQPIGMSAPLRLQDWFTNRKVARADRHQRVVATAQNEQIFWVEGERIDERFKLDNETTRRLKWNWQYLSEPVATPSSQC